MKTIKAKVHRLPTEEGCIAFEKDYGFKFIGTTKEGYYKTENQQPQHLYITTDEEINGGDWIYADGGTWNGTITQCKEVPLTECWRKIIATADPKLNSNQIEPYDTSKPYGIEFPQIPQDFIKAYCEQGGIDEVLVEVENYEILKARQLGVNSHLDAINSINSSIFPQPKLNPDNTIIIHPVEEKMYSRKEVEDKLLQGFKAMLDYYLKNGTIGDFNGIKWIEENL